MTEPRSFPRRGFIAGAAALLGPGLAARLFGAQDDPRVPTADEVIRAQAENAPLSMEFRGKTAEDCRKWQLEFSAKLRSLLGPHAAPKEWKTTIERRVELGDHVREELVLSAEGHPSLPLYLLRPRPKVEGRKPGILALHGHGGLGYDAVAGKEDRPGAAQAIRSCNYDYGLQLVRQGYLVVVPCLTPFGRRLGDKESAGKQDPCGVTFIRLQLLGKVLMAENLRDCLWAFEALARDAEVDPERLGCVGLSYGGRMTMLTAALEPRVRVAAVSGALNVMQERIRGAYSCGAQIIPGLLKYGDTPEIGSLIAPRPCVWEAGSRDALARPPWSDRALERLGRAYRALGAEDALQVDRFEGGHEWSGRVAYPLLKKILG